MVFIFLCDCCNIFYYNIYVFIFREFAMFCVCVKPQVDEECGHFHTVPDTASKDITETLARMHNGHRLKESLFVRTVNQDQVYALCVFCIESNCFCNICKIISIIIPRFPPWCDGYHTGLVSRRFQDSSQPLPLALILKIARQQECK